MDRTLLIYPFGNKDLQDPTVDRPEQFTMQLFEAAQKAEAIWNREIQFRTNDSTVAVMPMLSSALLYLKVHHPDAEVTLQPILTHQIGGHATSDTDILYQLLVKISEETSQFSAIEPWEIKSTNAEQTEPNSVASVQPYFVDFFSNYRNDMMIQHFDHRYFHATTGTPAMRTAGLAAFTADPGLVMLETYRGATVPVDLALSLQAATDRRVSVAADARAWSTARRILDEPGNGYVPIARDPTFEHPRSKGLAIAEQLDHWWNRRFDQIDNNDELWEWCRAIQEKTGDYVAKDHLSRAVCHWYSSDAAAHGELLKSGVAIDSSGTAIDLPLAAAITVVAIRDVGELTPLQLSDEHLGTSFLESLDDLLHQEQIQHWVRENVSIGVP